MATISDKDLAALRERDKRIAKNVQQAIDAAGIDFAALAEEYKRASEAFEQTPGDATEGKHYNPEVAALFDRMREIVQIIALAPPVTVAEAIVKLRFIADYWAFIGLNGYEEGLDGLDQVAEFLERLDRA